MSSSFCNTFWEIGLGQNKLYRVCQGRKIFVEIFDSLVSKFSDENSLSWILLLKCLGLFTSSLNDVRLSTTCSYDCHDNQV